jgi:hypothetical protein
LTLLEAYLLDHKLLLVAFTLIATAANVVVGARAARLFEGQDRMKQEEYQPPGVAGRIVGNARARTVVPFLWVGVILLGAWWLDRESFGVLAGGLMVAQAAATIFSVATLMNVRSLRASVVVGQLTYSAAYRYSLIANQLGACGFLVWLAFLLRGGPMLFGGGVFLIISALGYRRRSHQARRLVPEPAKADAT